VTSAGTMSEVIWTNSALDLLFEQVTKRFGPYSAWVRPNNPHHVEDDVTELEFRKFLDAFANVVDAKSGDAVGMILMIAAKPKLSFKHGRGEDILAAALRARFITVENVNITTERTPEAA
jgi:hypothetical protein